MNRPGGWRFTAYALTPRDAAGRPEFWSGAFAPGDTVRPYPAPRRFPRDGAPGAGSLVEVVTSDGPADGLVAHRLAQPCGLPAEPRIGPFAVGRMLTAVARPRSRAGGGPARFDIDATLSCAFQVARLSVPSGSTARAALGSDRLVVRLGMERREDGLSTPAETCATGFTGPYGWGAQGDPSGYFGAGLARVRALAYPLCVGPYEGVALLGGSSPGGLYAAYPGSSVPAVGMAEQTPVDPDLPSSPGGQRFDRVGARAAAAHGDQAPVAPRTVSVGWGWEVGSAPEPDAFTQIVGGSAQTFSAVDCRHGPGWRRDVDVSCLLDEPAPAVRDPVAFWVGVWPTAGAGHPIDFPEGGPAWQLPPDVEADVTHYWMADGCVALGYWALATG